MPFITQMKKTIGIIMLTALLIILSHIFLRGKKATDPSQAQIDAAWNYVVEHDMNREICLLVDYSLPSGCNRLWVWDFTKQHKLFECPVAHGKGRGLAPQGSRKDTARFSNEEESWLSSLGHSRIAERYQGQYGISYRLDGLDASNNNNRKRNIVLHGYKSVPQKPIFPLPSGRSKGCVMVAQKNMAFLDSILQTRKDVLLLCYA